MGFGDEIRKRLTALDNQAAVFRNLKNRVPDILGQAEAPSQVGDAEIQFTVEGIPRVQSETKSDGRTEVSCWRPEATAVTLEGESDLSLVPGNPDPRFPTFPLSDLEAQAPHLAAEAREALETDRRRSKPNRVTIYPPQDK